ncbi:MAG: hypothetical protein N2745_06080 [Syntrophorhabdaceae bacterium]|nr:hypothetical protein [Syntrophorhabdaceae bacterium]
MKIRITLFLLSVVLLLFGGLILYYRIEPFQYFFYIISWWSYILFMDTYLSFKGKGFLFLNRSLPCMIILSCGFWCIFEAINFVIKNWYYINLPPNTYERYLGYLISFGTVIPAVSLTTELFCGILGDKRIRPVRQIRRYPFKATLSGLIMLGLLISFPDIFFPLAWVFLLFIIDGYNYLKGQGSFMKDLEEGNGGRCFSALLSGLLCGLLWETWNYWSVAKWIYTVPFFEDMKVFEMPLLGYFGFPVFSLNVSAFLSFLKGIEKKRLILISSFLSLIFSFIVFFGIDKYTVFSYTVRPGEVDFIKDETKRHIVRAGIRTTYGIDLKLLDEDEKKAIKIVHLKGLGYKNYLKLKGSGVDRLEKLLDLSEGQLSKMLNEPNRRRIRVYIKAAKKETHKYFR